MIDAVRLYANTFIELTECSPGVFRYKDIYFDPIYNKGSIVSYKGNFRNLRVKVFFNRITISNSLHVFSKGNNYCDFNYEELCDAINEISTFFDLSPVDFKITRLEFGFNLYVHKFLSEQWQKVVDYKMTTITPMKSNGYLYGTKIDLTEWAYKVYNKTQEHYLHYKLQLKKNICRVEIEFKKMRLLPFINSLADLLFKENLMKIYENLLQKILNIKYYPPIWFLKKLNAAQRKLVFAGLIPEYWEAEDEINRNSSKKGRHEFLQLMKSYEPVFDLKDEIGNKFPLLLNKSTSCNI